MSLTVALREELAHADLGSVGRRLDEARGMADLGGTLRLRRGEAGPRVAVVVRCAQGAVARRLRDTLVTYLGVRPEIARRQGSNLRDADAYLVEISEAPMRELGLLGQDGRPRPRTLGIVSHPRAYLAGALMVAGSLSGVGQAVHLELRCPGPDDAEVLAPLLGGQVHGGRVVVKAGRAVERVLAQVGAERTLGAFQQGRQRRDLRRTVTRAVNAERANLRRATTAAAVHIEAIEMLVAATGWDAVPDDLADVALARVANPAATLAELGELLDPPVGKATVHRRIQRLVALADQIVADERS